MPFEKGNPTAFKKGQSGNPKGRTPKNRELELLIKATLEQEGGTNEAVEILLKTAREAKPKDSTAAVKILLAYGYGAPRQNVTLDLSVPHEEWNERREAWKKSQQKKKPKAPTGKP